MSLLSEVSENSRHGVGGKYREGSRSIFSGQYGDEASLPAILGAPKQNALLLGVGTGDFIAPLLSTGRISAIEGVDADPKLLKNFRKRCVGELKSIPCTASRFEALRFLRVAKNAAYDLIWVDEYTELGFSNSLREPTFYKHLKRIASPSAHVAINVYGPPAHLHAKTDATAVSYLSEYLKPHFEYVCAVPYRRNITLIATNVRWRRGSMRYDQSGEENNFSPSNRLTSLTQELRLRWAQPVEPVAAPDSRWAYFDWIEEDVRTGWSRCIRTLERICFLICGRAPFSLGTVTLRDFFSNEYLASSVLNHLFEVESDTLDAGRISCAFPIYIAMAAPSYLERFWWYPEFVLRNWQKLKEKWPEVAVLFHLTQSVAILQQDPVMFARLGGDFEKIVNQELQLFGN